MHREVQHKSIAFEVGVIGPAGHRYRDGGFVQVDFLVRVGLIPEGYKLRVGDEDLLGVVGLCGVPLIGDNERVGFGLRQRLARHRHTAERQQQQDGCRFSGESPQGNPHGSEVGEDVFAHADQDVEHHQIDARAKHAVHEHGDSRQPD